MVVTYDAAIVAKFLGRYNTVYAINTIGKRSSKNIRSFKVTNIIIALFFVTLQERILPHGTNQKYFLW